jgi:hypothetical protein
MNRLNPDQNGKRWSSLGGSRPNSASFRRLPCAKTEIQSLRLPQDICPGGPNFGAISCAVKLYHFPDCLSHTWKEVIGHCVVKCHL